MGVSLDPMCPELHGDRIWPFFLRYVYIFNFVNVLKKREIISFHVVEILSCKPPSYPFTVARTMLPPSL